VASTAYTEQVSTATVAPTVTYVQTVPDTTYYPSLIIPNLLLPYVWYPPVAFPLAGLGGGWLVEVGTAAAGTAEKFISSRRIDYLQRFKIWALIGLGLIHILDDHNSWIAGDAHCRLIHIGLLLVSGTKMTASLPVCVRLWQWLTLCRQNLKRVC